jgi:hypothetical protein
MESDFLLEDQLERFPECTTKGQRDGKCEAMFRETENKHSFHHVPISSSRKREQMEELK